MQKNLLETSKYCHFCVNQIEEIDFKDTQLLQRFLSTYSKIRPRRRTGVCAWHQRKLAEAIKRARYLALLPYTTR